MNHCYFRILSVAILFGALAATPSTAAEPGWSPVVIATGEYRQQLQATPIELRPYRPFHFYGNAVRRRHYGSTVVPAKLLNTVFSTRRFK